MLLSGPYSESVLLKDNLSPHGRGSLGVFRHASARGCPLHPASHAFAHDWRSRMAKPAAGVESVSYEIAEITSIPGKLINDHPRLTQIMGLKHVPGQEIFFHFLFQDLQLEGKWIFEG